MIKQSCTLFWENSGKNKKKKKVLKMINNLIKKEWDEKITKYKIKEGIKTFLYFFILISKLVLNKMCSLFLLKF